jgi:glycosyltransferase involved in cell wall biosynthesis
MKMILSHPTGNANVRNALQGMNDAGLLSAFHTSIATFPGSFFDVISRFKPFSELQRRQFDPSLRQLTQMHGFKEFGRLLAKRSGLSSLTRHEAGYFSIDEVYHYIDRKVSRALLQHARPMALYAYEDGALQSFKAARQMGTTCIYDLPIGYWRTARKLLEEERMQRPDWAATLTGFNDSIHKLERKEEELSLADHILVASSFTARTLNDYPGKLAPISVIPYGFPPVAENRVYTRAGNRPLKLLFVGGLSHRKGIANLFEAVATFGDKVALTIVGHKTVENCKPLNEALNIHNYIPSLPHAAILQLMQEQDVLIFPSLFEGFGLVITEAMSQGTPVITTDRTAGPDIIEHGKNGWLVEAGSTPALIASIENILIDPGSIKEVGQAAMEKARLRTWKMYGTELATALMKCLQTK